MFRTLRTGFDRMSLIVALSLMCTVFGLAVSAQIEPGKPLGKKFVTAYLHDVKAYEDGKSNAVFSANPNADGFAIYRPENLNKLFNKFVAVNYKK